MDSCLRRNDIKKGESEKEKANLRTARFEAVAKQKQPLARLVFPLGGGSGM